MKITQDCIAPDLRIPGRFYHFLDGLYPARMTMPSLPDWMAEWKSDPKENLYNRFLEREDGSQLRLLIHKPKRSLAKPLPVVFWIHGGGYALGMPEMMYLSLVRTIMENCVIVSCDYTLSGQKGFPTGLEDCWKALVWTRKHARKLGGREDQIFVGGESAGGGLAAALCLLARKRKQVGIACQILVYPMLDARMQTASMKDNNAPVWNEKLNRNAWNMVLENVPELTPFASPSLETDLSGLPPAISLVGSIDPFRDETLDYISRLRKAGVPATCRVYEGCYHAFDMMVPWPEEAARARRYFKSRMNLAFLQYFQKQDGSSSLGISE